MNLLLPTGQIKLDFFDQIRVVKVGYVRVVERNVAILANAHADNICWVLFEQGAVAQAFLLRISSVTVQVIHFIYGHFIKKLLFQIRAKALWSIRWQTNVLIHMK